jgi:tryptophan synthase beta chain
MYNYPDARGHFGQFGGRYVAETLMPALIELEAAYRAAQADPAFQAEVDYYLKDYVGRPSPLYFARRLTEHLGGAKIYLKREDLNHTGAHKVNNTIGQVLLARRMGKKKVIAETGAGQHGVATATVAALFGLECEVFMGTEDIRRQSLNVFRMKLLGAKVHGVTSGTATLKDAMNEALRHWVTHVRDTFYVIGTVAGPHPYPGWCAGQAVIGRETPNKSWPPRAPARRGEPCIGGISAMGMFYPFIEDEGTAIGVEAAASGSRLASTPPHRRQAGRGAALEPSCRMRGNRHASVRRPRYPASAGTRAPACDRPGRNCVSITDTEALAGFQARPDGRDHPALERPCRRPCQSSLTLPKALLTVCLSGRGGKDIHTVARRWEWNCKPVRSKVSGQSLATAGGPWTVSGKP